jgi:hypothetical protein
MNSFTDFMPAPTIAGRGRAGRAHVAYGGSAGGMLHRRERQPAAELWGEYRRGAFVDVPTP